MLFAAVAWADLVWPVLLATGIEQVRIDPGNTAVTPLDFVSYPYSHSLLMLVLWGAVLGFVYRATTGQNGSTFAVLALLVVSHWVLDFLTHRPDMPLYPGGPKLGLGLWNSVTGTVLVEVAMYALGVWIYLRATRPRDGVGRWSMHRARAVPAGRLLRQSGRRPAAFGPGALGQRHHRHGDSVDLDVVDGSTPRAAVRLRT